MVKKLRIKNDIEQLKSLNGFLNESLEAFGLDGAGLMDFKLAVEEAIVNVISYAYPGKKNKTINIQLEYEPCSLKVIVTDTGIAFDPTSKQEPDISLPLEERPIGGLGTFLLRQLMTKVTYCRTGNKNILTMIKEIN